MPVVTDYTALLSGDYWNGLDWTGATWPGGRPVFVTYSFATNSPAEHATVAQLDRSTFQAFDAQDQALARQALQAWDDASGITFLEVAPGQGQIQFAWYDFSSISWANTSGGFAFYPFGDWNFASAPYFFGDDGASGDVFMNLDYADAMGQPHYDTLLHEIGHAIGFKHTFEVLGNGHDETLRSDLDTAANTIMSYNGTSTILGPLDLDAVHYVYGTDADDGSQVASWSWNPVSRVLTQTGFETADAMIGVSVADVMNGVGGNDTILGLAGNDTLSGGGGNDAIWGGDDDDSIAGGLGRDTLAGGPGVDRFVFAAGESVFNDPDLITDWQAGDRIDLSAIDADATMAGLQHFAFHGNAAGDGGAIGDLHYYQAFGDTFVVGHVDGDGVPDVQIRLTGSQTLQAGDFVLADYVDGDFTGDGAADILWRNSAGKIVLWEMDGAQRVSFAAVANASSAWHIAEKADFTGDGKADLLWRSDVGRDQIWEMDGPTIVAKSSIASADTSWSVAGAADFTGDGKADILWRNDNGRNALWEMDGGLRVVATAVKSLGATWQVAGVADFTGDGKADIFWRNDAGQNTIWEMNGAQLVSSKAIPPAATSWQVAGVADFTGDGKADILWRDAAGRNVLWEMDGQQRVAATFLTPADLAWHVADTADFTRDGTADILWRNDNGTNMLWEIDAGQVAHQFTVPTVSPDWDSV